MTSIRHIVFDIGNVLIRWQRERPFLTLIPDHEERRRFLEEVCTLEWHFSLDAGTPIDRAMSELTAKFPAHADMIRAYKERWLESLPSAIDGTVEILRELVESGHDVTALTNFSQDFFPLTVEAYPFLRLFRGVSVSGLQRITKPDPAIYSHHAEAFELEPAAILFFDDSPPNVEAARAAGWNAEIFVAPERMRADLESHGIRATPPARVKSA